MKTPDEIKKGLECCAGVGRCFAECPYHQGNTKLECIRHMSSDALALIQQLESDKQQLEGLLNHMNQLRDAAAGRALKMEERVHQLEAERDAAVDALTKIVHEHDASSCEYCDNWDRYLCPSSGRTHCEKFKWRGVQKEE